MSDIMFNGDLVEIEGHWLKVQVWDIKLDSPDRRIINTGERRAIVHGVGDKLILNYNGDYPNGVLINGKLIVDSIYVKGQAGFSAGLTSPNITLGDPSQPHDIVPGEVPPGGSEWGLDLGASIKSLEATIDDLKKKINDLNKAVAKLQAGQP